MLTLRKNKGNKLTHDEMDANFEYAANPSGKKVYKALLSQTGTDAPTAIVLENTLGGEVVWSRDGIGSYVGFLEGAFLENKTWCSATKAATVVDSTNIDVSRGNTDSILIRIYLPTDSSYDGFSASILIEVYP